jgi:hypothetical protein
VVAQCDTLLGMDAEKALELIAAKVPALAAEALKARHRPSQALKSKAAARLSSLALSDASADFSGRDRALLSRIARPVEDDTRSVCIPPVRLTRTQMAELETEAAEAGLTLSDIVRRRLFGA